MRRLGEPDSWGWRRFVQLAIAMAALGVYLTLQGNRLLAFVSYGIGLVGAAVAQFSSAARQPLRSRARLPLPLPL